MANSPKTERKMATSGQVIAISRLLDTHLDKETKRYKNGYGDARIAKETGAPLSAVARVRRDNYCDLNDQPRRLLLDQRVIALEARMARLERELEMKPLEAAG